MVLKRLLFTLLHNAQVVERLSESRPVRRAAQLTVFAITKARIAGRDATMRLLQSDTLRQIRRESGVPRGLGGIWGKVGRIRKTFVNEVKRGMRDTSRQMKNEEK